MFARKAGLLLVLGTVWPAVSHGSDVWQEMFGSPPEDSGNWPRHLRVGALVGFNLKAQFSMNGVFPMTSGDPGIAGGGQNHEYDDGYVRIDRSGNADPLDGSGPQTWNWGYESGGQVQGGRLYFHNTQSFTATSSSATVDSSAQVGFDTAYGQRITEMWGGTLGWEFGFGFLPVKITDNLSLPATAARIVHSFDLGGIQPPQAPYQGSFNGPGATISDEAVVEPTEILPATLGGSHTLDVTLYNFRLGPTLQWELNPRIAVAVSAGASFGIVTGDLKYNETLLFTSDGTTASNQGKVGDTQFVYGGYVAGTVLFHAVKNGDLYCSLQYMPMSTATFSGGGREAKLDLTGGLYISAGINWPF